LAPLSDRQAGLWPLSLRRIYIFEKVIVCFNLKHALKRAYFIQNILPANDAILTRDVFLVIMYADRIPPHILICVNGKLFSLSVKGHLLDEDLNLYLRTIRKYKIGTLFIKLVVPQIFTMEQLHDSIGRIMLSYPRIEMGSGLRDGNPVTCLAPVKDFCNSLYCTDMSGVQFIFDLLPKLEKQGVIGSSYHLNMERSLLPENNFAMNTYTMYEVNENIYSLSVHAG
jgi:hypothetical protein